MKKQINPTIKAHLIRGAFYLLLLVAVCAIPFALAQRNNTIKRVASHSTSKPSVATKSAAARPGFAFRTAQAHVSGAADLAKSHAPAGPKQMPSRVVQPRIGRVPSGTDCDTNPNIVKHDDGIIEDGYSGNPAAGVTQVIFVDKFTPTTYPNSYTEVCLDFVTLAGGPATQNVDIVVYDDDGPGGSPGTLLGAVNAQSAATHVFSVGQTPIWNSYDITSLGLNITSGSVYIGARWAPPSPTNVYISADESTDRPVGFAGGYWFNDLDAVWAPIQNAFPAYVSCMIRAVITEAGPSPTPSPTPTATPPCIVVNGGFETGGLAPWTNTGDTSFSGVGSGNQHSGSFEFFAGPTSSDGFLDQVLPTVDGQAYDVSFWLENTDSGGSNHFGCTFGSVTLVPTATLPAGNYTLYTFTNVTPGANATLHFIFFNPPAFFYLDDVCVSGGGTGPSPTPTATATPGGGCPSVITQSTSTTIEQGDSVSCNNGVAHTDNHYERAFNMNDFTGGQAYDVTSVDIGFELAVSGSGQGQPIVINLYANHGAPFPGGDWQSNLLATSGNVNVPDQQLTFPFNIPITTTVPAGTLELVMEVFTPDGEAENNLIFLGANSAPETGLSYLYAVDCGVNTPTPTGDIGFPNTHWVFNVNGSCEGGTSPTPTATSTASATATATATSTTTATATATATPTATAEPRSTPTPRPRPTPAPR